MGSEPSLRIACAGPDPGAAPRIFCQGWQTGGNPPSQMGPPGRYLF